MVKIVSNCCNWNTISHFFQSMTCQIQSETQNMRLGKEIIGKRKGGNSLFSMTNLFRVLNQKYNV